MKIIVTGTRGIPDVMGGVETHCEELFPRIARRGEDVTVIRRKNYVHDGLTEFYVSKYPDAETVLKPVFRQAGLGYGTTRRMMRNGRYYYKIIPKEVIR